MGTDEIIENIEAEDEEERLRRLRRRERIEEMKRQKEKTLLIHRCVMGVTCAVLLFVGIGIGTLIRSAAAGGSGETGEESRQFAAADQEEDSEQEEQLVQEVYSVLKGRAGVLPETVSATVDVPSADDLQETEDEQPVGDPQEQDITVFSAHRTESTAGFGESIVSEYGILIDIEAGTILADKSSNDRMSPASMTKVLTVLTAAELLGIEDESAEVLDDSFTMTIEITDYSYVNDCSIAGFDVGETVTVRDLFYGTILPSGADAAVGLAVYTAGSQEAFVERMNEKLQKLGLSATTHFTNCVGLYDEDHYSTVYDIAVILKEAADNVFCRQVLSEHIYTTSLTEQHPEGLTISNWFLRRIEDKDTHGEVICGKTGYVNQSGSCAASLATDGSGREYLCVTAGSTTSWRCIYDQTDLFQTFLPAE